MYSAIETMVEINEALSCNKRKLLYKSEQQIYPTEIISIVQGNLKIRSQNNLLLYLTTLGKQRAQLQ